MTEQDDGLDKLSAIVQRQKMIARSIGQELGVCMDVAWSIGQELGVCLCLLTDGVCLRTTDEQNKMLDDLDNRVERTNVHLGKTTKGVMKLL